MKKTVKLCCSILLCFIMALGLCGCGSSTKSKKSDDDKKQKSGLQITYQVTGENPSKQDMDDTLNKLQKRADIYSLKAKVYQKGDRQIIIELPGVAGEDADKALEELGKPGSLEFVVMSSDDTHKETVLEGKEIKNAEVITQKDMDDNKEYAVQLTLTDEGAEKFGDATLANIGKQIWIMYDEQEISAPFVQAAIYDGSPVITGLENEEEAKKLASLIRIGALPLELEKVDSEVR